MTEFDEMFDFVVVGSGAGSMCAALVMRRAGKSVLVLEKTEAIGGTTARAGGVMWIPNNPIMKAMGIQDSYENAVTYLDHVVGDDPSALGAARERRLTYVREAPRMIEFLIQEGIELTRPGYWPDYYDELPGASKEGRGVVAKLFDVNELGEWTKRLRLNWLRVPAMHDEALILKTFKHSWRGRAMVLRIGLRGALAKLRGKLLVTAGAALQGRMLQAALRAGVEFRLNAPVHELIVEDGAVKGVSTAINGRPWQIGARLGVLINAGGFSRNQRMRDRFQPGTKVEWTNTAPGDTGEMIEEMMRHGAAVAQMEEVVGFQCSVPPGLPEDAIRLSMQGVTASPHAILVDQSGVRYQNEGGSYMAYCKAMLERNKSVPAVPSWAVLDSQFLAKYMLGGLTTRKQLEAWVRQGFLLKDASIEGLARQLDIDSMTLSATVQRFNGFVANNEDKDFHRGQRAYDQWLGDPSHKPSATLGAIEKPPFYALPVYPGDVGTYGGVVTDCQARVLREDGSVIPGLYATATSTASVMGRAYPGAGSSIGPGFVWGYVAARHAANAESVGDRESISSMLSNKPVGRPKDFVLAAPKALAVLALLVGSPAAKAAQATEPPARVCNPSLEAPVVVASAAERRAAKARAQPPLTDTSNGFAWPDTPLGVLKNGSAYTFFGSDGGYHARQQWQGHVVGNDKAGSVVRTVGTLDAPLGQGIPLDNSIARNPAAWVNPNYSSYAYMGGGPVFQVPQGMTGAGKLLVVYHAELPNDALYAVLGLAASSDNGANWTDLGEIVRLNQSYESGLDGFEIGDGPLVVSPDGNFLYLYFPDWTANGTEHSTTTTHVSVARAALAAVLEAAFGSTPGRVPPFEKYYKGSWTLQPAIGGASSDLMPTSAYQGYIDVHYDSALARYVMITSNDTVFSYAESVDGLTWTAPLSLGTFGPIAAYPTAVGTGDDPHTLGTSFYIYFTHLPSNGAGWSGGVLKRMAFTCK